MITKTEFMRGLDMLASRRPGTYEDDSTVSLVCSPTGMVPEVFYIFLYQSFGEVAKSIKPQEFRGGAMTMGELYDRLTQPETEAAD